MAVLEVLCKACDCTKCAAPNRTRIIWMVYGKEKSLQVRRGDTTKSEKTRM